MGISVAADKPAIQTCFACLHPFVLGSALYQTCDACRMFMKAGIICIGVTDDTPEGSHLLPGGVGSVLTYGDAKNYRSGNWCVVTEERLRDTPRMVYSNGTKARYVILRDSDWLKLGLPRAGKSGASQVRKGKYLEQAED